jgi:hypothetical protein
MNRLQADGALALGGLAITVAVTASDMNGRSPAALVAGGYPHGNDIIERLFFDKRSPWPDMDDRKKSVQDYSAQMCGSSWRMTFNKEL